MKMKLSQGLLTLFGAAEKFNIGVTLDYDNGLYIPGELIDYENLDKDPDPATIRQGPKGYRVTIAGCSPADDNGDEIFFPSLDRALGYAIPRMARVLEERGAK